LPPPEYVR